MRPKKSDPFPVALAAGPLRLLYDNGMLRSITLDGTEFIRRMYMALRDRHWNTIPYTITGQTIRQDSTSFSVTFTAVHDDNGIRYSWKGTFTGSPDGTITAALDGTAQSTFLRNRIGWCVLHPLRHCKDLPCEVHRPDGTVLQTRFPGDAIAPHEPFPPLRGLRYRITGATDCAIAFTGDLFETEDQRNWTDASFKTYSTPQSHPAPVQVENGDRLEQTITISLSQQPKRRHESAEPSPQVIDITALATRLRRRPRIGFGISVEELFSHDPEKLPQLPGDHLRLPLDAALALPTDLAQRITLWCSTHKTKLELALYCTERFADECPRAAAALQPCAAVLDRILLLHHDVTLTRPGALDAARSAFHFPDRDGFFTGTDRYFVEINRAKALEPQPSGIVFSAAPQVHTFDDCIIMENLEGLGEVLRHAWNVCDGRQIALSPLTLRPRKNPLRPEKAGGDDIRQTTGFGAAWAAGALSVICGSPVHSCTFFTGLTGPQGLFAENGVPYPLYHVFTSGILDGDTVAVGGTHDVETNGRTFLQQQKTAIIYSDSGILLCANLTPDTVRVAIPGLPENSRASIVYHDASENLQSSGWQPFSAIDRSAVFSVPGYGILRVTV